MIELRQLDAAGIARAQHTVAREHYLHKPVDARCSVEGYEVVKHTGLTRSASVGFLLLGRPQAAACYPWYGSVEDVNIGRARVTRWQVLNLARVWLSPATQPGGDLHLLGAVPGFVDRRGQFRSTLASTVLSLLAERVGLDYLLRRPPCFLQEPYELRWLLSYCDIRLHRGTIYRAAGWELYRTNAAGIQTWRTPLEPLTTHEHELVRAASQASPRSREYRARRAQAQLFEGRA